MDDLNRLTNILKNVECFTSLDDDSLHLLIDEMRPVAYEAGSTICNEGEHGDWMFIVDSGMIRVLKGAEHDSTIEVAVLRAGDFGGIQSIFEAKPRSATLKALNPVKLWSLDHDTFRRLIEENGKLAMCMLSFMSHCMSRDSHNLAVTLQYVDESGMREIYEECSPQERLVLDTMIHKVMAAESLDAVMNFVFDSIQKISGCNRLGLAFLEDDGNRVVSYWARADYEPILLPKGYAADLAGSSLEDILNSGTPRVINDLAQYAKDHPESHSTDLILKEGIHSSMTCPLIVENRPIGFLFRSSLKPNAYDEHQIRLHMAIADRLSQAVEKAYRIEELTSANQAYFEVLGFVSHELKSPLASITMDAEALIGGYLGDLEPIQINKLDNMIRKARYLLDLIGEYLNLSRLEGGQMKPSFRKDVDFIADIIEPSIDIVLPQIEDKKMILTRNWNGDLSTIECAPDLMQIVMVNLLSNAVKYAHDEGEIRITISQKENQLKVDVRNDGPGFPDSERSRLFRKFSRIQTQELLSRKGTGVGLYTTWRIITSHHGKIAGDSEVGKWAEFTFEIPQPIPDDDKDSIQKG